MLNIHSLQTRLSQPLRKKSTAPPAVPVLSPPCIPSHAPCNGSQPVTWPTDQRTCRRIRVCSSRREVLLGLVISMPAFAAAASEQPGSSLMQLEVEAYDAYANRDFKAAVEYLTDIMRADAGNPRWLEMRAQVLVDGKNFEAAVIDFNAALELVPADDPIMAARLLAGRALAFEGLSKWREALADYNQALDLAAAGGESPDPYVINARGNCHNSLGEWAAAREDYLISSQLFQQAKGFRGRGGTTTQRLDGAIYAASNAALMLAQMGDEQRALKEFERISRRAPGSSDTRAALAALYWRNGQPQQAEDVWNFACTSIAVGCSKYQDKKWLQEVRRWPPSMVSLLQDFLALKPTSSGLSSSSRRQLVS